MGDASLERSREEQVLVELRNACPGDHERRWETCRTRVHCCEMSCQETQGGGLGSRSPAVFMMAHTPMCLCVCVRVYAGSLSGHITEQSTVMWLVCLSCVGAGHAGWKLAQ